MLEVIGRKKHLSSIEDGCFSFIAPEATVDVSLLIGTPVKEVLEGFPEHLDNFAERILNDKYTGNIEWSEIGAAVNKHVRKICEIIRRYDSRFSMSVFNTGSTAEGTKVGVPDEFDFALCLDHLIDMCDIETDFDPEGFEYARLKFRDNHVSDEYVSFSDMERNFLPLPYLHMLFRYLRRGMYERELWEDGNLFTRSEERLYVISGKPVLTYCVYWNGTYYKQLKISIDLVPAVYRQGWWPHGAKFDNKGLISDEVQAAGCLILMQTKKYSFDRQWYRMSDSITFTCKSTCVNIDEERILKVSVAPAEIALMKTLPETYRQGYVLAKIMRGADVCPNVNIDLEPPVIDERLSYKFRRLGRKAVFVQPSDYIKSYWLKQCIFYIADETSTYKNPLQITAKVYQKMLELAFMWNFRPYILKKDDLFLYNRFESHDVEVFITRRMVSICTVGALLGLPFPRDIKKWIVMCKKNCPLEYL